MIKLFCALSLAALCAASHAACPTWPTAERFELHGDEVIDKRSGLVWQRCVVGQTWNGSTCTGTAARLDVGVAEAMRIAKAATPTDSPAGWRVPNVKELSSLVDRGCHAPAIDTAAFPATPAEATTTSTPSVIVPFGKVKLGLPWQVQFWNGSLSTEIFGPDGHLMPVRLVRSAR